MFDPDAPSTHDGLFGLPHTPEEALAVVIPVPFEATTSYQRGTAKGPNAVLQASYQVDLYDPEGEFPWEKGIAMLPTDPQIESLNFEACQLSLPIIEAGGVVPSLQPNQERVNEIGETINQYTYQATQRLLKKEVFPMVLGGDHSVPFGAIQAASEHYPELGVLHIDAHHDLREAYEGFTWSHASIFHNVMTRLSVSSLVQVGIRDFGQQEAEMAKSDERIHVWYDSELANQVAGGESWVSLCQKMVENLPKHVWVSWDIDGLDPSLCPNTGTPVPGGLSWHQSMILLKVLSQSGRLIVGCDLCEVAPGETEWDANVGARLLYKLAGFSLQSRTFCENSPKN